MLYGLSTLSGAIGETAMVESPCEQCKLSITTGEVYIEVGKVPCKVSALPDVVGELSSKVGEANTPLGGEAMGNRKGLWKKRWSAKPIEDLQHELTLLQGRLIGVEEVVTSEWATRVDEA